MEQSRVLAALGALAHDTRLDIVRLLKRHGPKGLFAGDISREMGLTASALSFHLSALDNAGLVHALREGRNVRYTLNIDYIGAVFGHVLSQCCGDDPEIRDRCLNMGSVKKDHLT